MSKSKNSSKETTSKTWLVYILECKDGSYYTGITNNLEKRIKAHADGSGAKYTKGRGPFSLVFTQAFSNRQSAARREIEIKKLPRPKKEKLFQAEN